MLGWAWANDLGNELPTGDQLSDFEVRLSANDSMREALDTVITSRTKVAPMFDGDIYLGMVTVEQISAELVE